MSTEKVLSACLKAWGAQDLSACKPLGLDASTWLAAITALATALVFITRLALRWKRATQSGGHYISGGFGRSRFRKLCRCLKPLMDENYRIFSGFGPNSGRGDGLPKIVRVELGIWHQARDRIVENNAQLRLMITHNLSAVPRRYRSIFMRWLDHIDAFRAHVADDTVDYREHQFPKEVSEIVTRGA